MEHLLYDPADPDTRVEFGMAEAEVAQRLQWRASAEVFRAIDATLREAAAHPDVFIDAVMLRGDAVEFAVRAAAADLAVRLSLSESTVRNHGHVAKTLRECLPKLWAWFADGDVSTQNAREAAAIVGELPAEHWAEFESQILDAARNHTAARFRVRARAIREKLLADSITERHALASVQRGVWTEIDRDGMGWLHAYVPAEKLAMIDANLEATAFALYKEADENRTMAQLRADVLADMLTGVGGPSPVGVTVALTVPVMTLLGQSIEPALLEGVGPISIETAKRLTATAPSLTRLLTDPINGAIIHMDSKKYRPDAALKRFLAIIQVTCDFSRCGRRAEYCDLDHTIARMDGGATCVGNLSHRCRKHHVMKHQTKWRVERTPDAKRPVWTSPTGFRREADPPPF